MSGVSAGAICWFEHGLTNSLGAGLRPGARASACCRAGSAPTPTATPSGSPPWPT